MKDVYSGRLFLFAKKRDVGEDYPFSISIAQDVKRTETFENKLYNLDFAAAEINRIVIMPGEIFSFWNAIGNPNQGTYKPGRSLRNGQLIQEPGGGLCQVSGIIYHIALLAGLTILERHNHSKDIYTDETRFTPLGTDATVAYGYKDLRVQNSFPFPVRFKLYTKDEKFFAEIESKEEIKQKQLLFDLKTENAYKIVEVKDEVGEVVGVSWYL